MNEIKSANFSFTGTGERNYSCEATVIEPFDLRGCVLWAKDSEDRFNCITKAFHWLSEMIVSEIGFEAVRFLDKIVSNYNMRRFN